METALPFGYLAQALDALGASDILEVTVPAAAVMVSVAISWVRPSK